MVKFPVILILVDSEGVAFLCRSIHGLESWHNLFDLVRIQHKVVQVTGKRKNVCVYIYSIYILYIYCIYI